MKVFKTSESFRLEVEPTERRALLKTLFLYVEAQSNRALFLMSWSSDAFVTGYFFIFLSQPTGPYMIIVGTPSKIEDVIQYADFSQKVSAVELVDDTTVDEEPNLDDLYGLMDGNIQLNDTDLHVLPAGEFY